MRIAVLGSPESWYLADLRRAAGSSHELISCTFRDICSHIGASGCDVRSGETALGEADCLLVRTMPPGSLEQVVFRMDALSRLEAQGKLVVNPPRAIEAAVDKYLATTKLQAAGLPTPRTAVCQTAEDALEAFYFLGGDIVLKPLFGAEGRGLTRLNDEALALRAFKLLAELRAVLYLQEFIPHAGADIRALIIGDAIYGMKRINPHDWRTNVSRGAVTQPQRLSSAMVELAQCAAAAIQAPLAGVDLLPGDDGQMYVLEVNAVPGWRALAKTLQVDVAWQTLQYLESVLE